MSYVKISSIVEPSQFAEYTQAMVLEKNELLKSGIAVVSPELQAEAQKGGREVTLPRWADLPMSVESTSIDDSTDEISQNSIGTDSIVVPKLFRAVDWAYSPVVEVVAGSDPAFAIANRISTWDVKDDTTIVLNVLKGVFDSSTGVLKDTNVNDIAIEDGNAATASNLISDDAIQDARFLLGDHFEDLGGIIMHSTIYKALENLDLITFVAPSVQHARPIPFYHGMRVLIDDTMTVTAGSTSGYKYDTYLFGKGAFLFSSVPLPKASPAFEIYKNPKSGKGGGQVDLIYRKQRIWHPRGISWVGTPAGSYPTNAELATPSNWSKVYDTKEIPMVKLTTNG